MTDPVYTEPMLKNARQDQIIKHVSRFGMVPSGHIRELFFWENSSKNSFYRTLGILVDRKYLARVERRPVGGNGAGSGQGIFKLGSQGKLVSQARRSSPRLSDIHHTLAIADAYLAAKRAEREGLVKIVGYATEPAAWAIVAGVELRPDLHIELSVPSQRYNATFFIEVDMDSHGDASMLEKMSKYVHAWTNSKRTELADFPRVLYLVPDEERVVKIKKLIQRQDQEVQDKQLFMVATQGSFPQVLFS